MGEENVSLCRKGTLGSGTWVRLHRLPRTRAKGSGSIRKALEVWTTPTSSYFRGLYHTNKGLVHAVWPNPVPKLPAKPHKSLQKSTSATEKRRVPRNITFQVDWPSTYRKRRHLKTANLSQQDAKSTYWCSSRRCGLCRGSAAQLGETTTSEYWGKFKDVLGERAIKSLKRMREFQKLTI